jgi:hypothetical protein
MKQQRFDDWVAFITAPVPEMDDEIVENVDG